MNTHTFPSKPRARHQSQLVFGNGEPITVALAGCGGNGAQMLSKLARLDYALRRTTHPGGLHVTTFDPDHVSHANVGRQLFAPADVGQNKAVVLTSRINAFFGLDWCAAPQVYDGWIPSFLHRDSMTPPDVLVTCVDTALARRTIARMHTENREGKPNSPPIYWLDLGNERASGQVVLGEPLGAAGFRRQFHPPVVASIGNARQFAAGLLGQGFTGELIPRAARLPTVVEMFPELMDEAFDEGDEPSCSLAQALERQSLFVNDAMANCAAQLLDTLTRGGSLDYHGAYINLETGRTNPIPVPVMAELEAVTEEKLAA